MGGKQGVRHVGRDWDIFLIQQCSVTMADGVIKDAQGAWCSSMLRGLGGSPCTEGDIPSATAYLQSLYQADVWQATISMEWMALHCSTSSASPTAPFHRQHQNEGLVPSPVQGVA